MYYLYLLLSFLNLDKYFSGAGTATLEDAMSMFTKAESKLGTAIVQFEKSEGRTKEKVERLRLEFQKKENQLNELKRTLVDNRVKSKKHLDKIKSFLED